MRCIVCGQQVNICMGGVCFPCQRQLVENEKLAAAGVTCVETAPDGSLSHRGIPIRVTPAEPSAPVEPPAPKFIDDMREADWRKGVEAVFDSYRLR